MANHRRWPRGYYSYVFFYPDGTPYYVGAGKGSRANPKSRVLNGVRHEDISRERWGRGSLVVIYEHASREAAFNDEKRLISEYGRADIGTGALVNRTGGRGQCGIVLTEAQRKARSERQKGKRPSEEARAAMSERLRGNKRLLGHKHTEETKLKISAKGKGRKICRTEEQRRRISEAVRASNIARTGVKMRLSDEQRAARSERGRAMMQRRLAARKAGEA